MPKDKLLKQLYKRHKRTSKKRLKEHSLSFSIFKKLSLGNCVYCGAEPSNTFKYAGKELKYSGIDRIDSAIGYHELNCVSCCSFCNSLKGAMRAATWFDFLVSVIKLHDGWAPDWFMGYGDPNRPTKSTWYGRR